MNNIDHVNIREVNGDFLSAIITYKDGKEELVEGTLEVARVLISFAKQEGISYSELKKDPTKIIINGPKKAVTAETVVPKATPVTPEKTVTPEPDMPKEVPKTTEKSVATVKEDLDDDDIDFEEEYGDDRRKSGKGKKTLKVAGVLVVVGGLIIGGIEIIKNFAKNGFVLNRGKPSTTAEEQIGAGLSGTREDGGYYSVIRTGDPNPDNGSQYGQNLEASHAQGDLGEKIREISYNKTMTHDEFLANLSRLNLDLASNINDVKNLLQGKGIHGDVYLLHLETIFDQGTIDYAAVKHFCALRNNIVINAYEHKNPAETRELVVKFYDVYTKFAFNGYALSQQNDFEYCDISAKAKYIIHVLAEEVLSLPVDYSMTYITGEEWSKETVIAESVTQFDITTRNLNEERTK